MSFEIITRYIVIDLVFAPKRFTVFTVNPRFVSSDVTSSSEISVGMSLITIFRTRSSGSEKVEKTTIVFSLFLLCSCCCCLCSLNVAEIIRRWSLKADGAVCRYLGYKVVYWSESIRTQRDLSEEFWELQPTLGKLLKLQTYYRQYKNLYYLAEFRRQTRMSCLTSYWIFRYFGVEFKLSRKLLYRGTLLDTWFGSWDDWFRSAFLFWHFNWRRFFAVHWPLRRSRHGWAGITTVRRRSRFNAS